MHKIAMPRNSDHHNSDSTDLLYNFATSNKIHSFIPDIYIIHSFIPNISIEPLQVYYYSEALLTKALTLCRSLHAEAQHITVSEGLAQFPYTWRLKWDSNLRPSERKAPNYPLSHNASQMYCIRFQR